MESLPVKKPKTIIRRKKVTLIKDSPKEGEGRLFITLGKKTSIKIGDVRLHVVKVNFNENGVSQFRLMFIGPKNIKINRIDRDEKEISEALKGVKSE